MYRTNNERREMINAVIVLVIGIISIIGIFGPLLYIKDSRLKKEINTNLKNVQSKELKSCILDSSDTFNMSGSFVLGIGSFQGESHKDIYYYFYMKKEEGFTLERIESKYVEIVPIDNGEPYIKGHFDEHGELYEPVDFWSYDEEYKYNMTHYKMYIPSDYITEEYNINIENVENH